MTDINPELIELHAEAICNATGGPQWDELQSTRQAGVMRAEARAALAVVAPLIAAHAWEQGYAASQQEWKHVYDGHTVEQGDESGMCTECGQGNPYARKDHIMNDRTDLGGRTPIYTSEIESFDTSPDDGEQS